MASFAVAGVFTYACTIFLSLWRQDHHNAGIIEYLENSNIFDYFVANIFIFEDIHSINSELENISMNLFIEYMTYKLHWSHKVGYSLVIFHTCHVYSDIFSS